MARDMRAGCVDGEYRRRCKGVERDVRLGSYMDLGKAVLSDYVSVVRTKVDGMANVVELHDDLLAFFES